MINDESGITRIKITDETDKARNASSGVIWNLKRTLVGRREEPKANFALMKDYSNTRTVVIEKDGKTIELPDKIAQNLATFFSTRPEQKSKFDCSSFAHFLNGVPYEFGRLRDEKWDINQITSDDHLRAGDTIAITNGENFSKITHLAVYVADGVYISKFGTGGGIVFATLEEMKKGFGGEFVFKLEPKENY